MLSTCCYACRIADYILRGKTPKSKLGGLSPPVYKVGGAIAPLAPPVPTPMTVDFPDADGPARKIMFGLLDCNLS